jgi:hypothetical protein
LISAPELSKYLTISMCSWFIAVNNGDSLQPLHLLIAACFPSKAFTIHKLPIEHATISGVLYVCHTRLLQEIVNHVECSNLSISLVFGSDIMENTRLLLLGCHSNTLDMVKLILKYVDRKCIDIDFIINYPAYYLNIIFGARFHIKYPTKQQM